MEDNKNLKSSDDRFLISNKQKNTNAFKEIKRFLMKEINIVDELDLKVAIKDRSNKPNTYFLRDNLNVEEKFVKKKNSLTKPNEEILKKALNLLD